MKMVCFPHPVTESVSQIPSRRGTQLLASIDDISVKPIALLTFCRHIDTYLPYVFSATRDEVEVKVVAGVIEEKVSKDG